MSIIKTCGGYDKAKIYVEQFKKLNLDGAVKLFEDELLEYRRANNIFEEGDKVVMANLGVKKVMEVKSVKGKWNPMHVLLSDGWTHRKDEIRHATDIEIAQGYRS